MISLTSSPHRQPPAAPRLPLSRRLAGRGGKSLSALFLVLAASLAGPTCEAAGEARAQVEQAVSAQLDAQLREEARRNGWQGLRSQFSHELLGSLPPVPCSQPLQLQRRSDEPSALARQRYEVRCADGAGWAVTVSSQADAFLPVLVTAAIIDRGQVLGAGDLKLQAQNIARAHHGFFTRPEQVIGQGARRRLRAGQLLTPQVLSGAQLVKRGQQVRINASRDGIQASTPGQALANGQQGEVIKVRNLSSEKVIQARVVEAGVVSSTFE